MSLDTIHTVEQYAEHKLDLPEGGRWTELVAGRIITLQPPDDEHGNVVRNATLAFSKFAHRTQRGYACFEIGLITARSPDTVRCPPACYFLDGAPFAEIDNLIAQTKPALVVDKDDRVEITFSNTSMMAHPMHLHGHRFQVVAIDGERISGAMRDTVLVPPAHAVTIAVDATNPGQWAFHCHHLYHMQNGMMTTFTYRA